MKRSLTMLFVAVALAGAVFAYRGDVGSWVDRFFGSAEQSTFSLRDALQEFEQRVFTPPPLRKNGVSNGAELRRSEVFRFTNEERAAAGLAAYQENNLLNAAAALKLEDMFGRQYFAHVSPDGEGPAYFVKKVGYAYVVIGENLALGNFEDDADLVQAWMESPGHRENILHERFEEMGVAVGRGVFEGREVWLAVQEFSMPVSSCPQPEEELKTEIEENLAELDVMKLEITEQHEALDDTRPRRGQEYQQKIDAYNELVDTYNGLFKETRSLIDRYNDGVRAFNVCASGI